MHQETDPAAEQKWPPVIIALLNDHDDVAIRLIEKGAAVDAVGPDGWTPIHYAAYLDSVELAQLLAKKEAKLDQVTDAGRTALEVASHEGNSEIIDVLLDHGVDPDSGRLKPKRKSRRKAA